MRVLLFSWRDPKHPKAGGAEQVVHEHCKGWIKKGHQVTLFASKTGNLPQTENLDGVEIIRSGNQYVGVQIAGFLFYLKNHKKYDLVVDQFHGIPFFTPLFVFKPKIALIQEVAKNVWFLNPLSWPLNWLVGLLGYLSEPVIFLLYRGTYFMTGSESAKKDIEEMGIEADKIAVVPHGVLIRGKGQGARGNVEKAKLKTVVFLGVLSKDKGIEDALSCFAILNKQPGWQFWVIGRPETAGYGQYIEELSIKLGLKNKIKFWGFVALDKKFELLSKARVLVNPSVHEGWGLVNIEANAMGTPVVAYANAGLIDSVKDGISGILCKEKTPEKLAETTANLLQNNITYEKLRKGSIEWSKKFTWEKSVQKSLALLKKVANEY